MPASHGSEHTPGTRARNVTSHPSPRCRDRNVEPHRRRVEVHQERRVAHVGRSAGAVVVVVAGVEHCGRQARRRRRGGCEDVVGIVAVVATGVGALVRPGLGPSSIVWISSCTASVAENAPPVAPAPPPARMHAASLCRYRIADAPASGTGGAPPAHRATRHGSVEVHEVLLRSRRERCAQIFDDDVENVGLVDRVVVRRVRAGARSRCRARRTATGSPGSSRSRSAGCVWGPAPATRCRRPRGHARSA